MSGDRCSADTSTGEMVIRLIDGKIDRKYDDVTGLNLFHFA